MWFTETNYDFFSENSTKLCNRDLPAMRFWGIVFPPHISHSFIEAGDDYLFYSPTAHV